MQIFERLLHPALCPVLPPTPCPHDRHALTTHRHFAPLNLHEVVCLTDDSSIAFVFPNLSGYGARVVLRMSVSVNRYEVRPGLMLHHCTRACSCRTVSVAPWIQSSLWYYCQRSPPLCWYPGRLMKDTTDCGANMASQQHPGIALFTAEPKQKTLPEAR